MLVSVPGIIEIGPFSWKIFFDSTLREEENVHGQTNLRKMTIALFPGIQSPEIKENTLWHEIVHAINYSYLNENLTESEVNLVGNGFHQVMKSLGIQLDFKDLPSP